MRMRLRGRFSWLREEFWRGLVDIADRRYAQYFNFQGCAIWLSTHFLGLGGGGT